MKFTIFHHDDLDGYITAVLAKIVFCPDKETRFEQLSYGMDMAGIIEDAAEETCVITVDIPPHKDAVVCVDHHRTAEELVDSLRLLGEGPEVYFDPRAKSAAQILFDSWKKVLAPYKSIVDEVSIVDGAGYADVDDACKSRWSLQFAYALEHLSSDERDEVLNTCAKVLMEDKQLPKSLTFWPTLVSLQRRELFDQILEFAEQCYISLQTRYEYTKSHGIMYNHWLLLVCDGPDCFHRFGIYKLFPECYGYVATMPSSVGGAGNSIGLNGFLEGNPALERINCGSIAARRPGGGGHRRAAGFETPRLLTVEELRDTVDNELNPLIGEFYSASKPRENS